MSKLDTDELFYESGIKNLRTDQWGL